VTGGAPGLDLAIYGLLLIAVVGLAPRGIAGLLSALVPRRFRFSSVPEQPHG
jgi:ABC-type branched-subunit amino acid transport system permease subunit